MNERITIRMEPDLAEGLERFIRDELIDCRSRQDAFRHIVRDWLGARGYLELPLSEDVTTWLSQSRCISK
ncbi:ribbon-helix-helix domain-containing protein [Devosia sp. A449]